MTDLVIDIPAAVNNVIKTLESHGFEAFIVGGCVRDHLMGIVPKDYDIATNASPEQIMSCFSGSFRVIGSGIKHGTVTVVSSGENVEVTTYRTDGSYTDHRRPDSVEFVLRLEDDLSRRDFTINAMAYSEKTGLVDKFGGKSDIADRIIRCVGSPALRFEEDALRIMRALRFSSRLGFVTEPATAAAIHAKKRLLADISAERKACELEGIVTGKAPAAVMLAFSDVFCELIPEFAPCIGFSQHSRYHRYTVWEHIAYALERSKNDREIRLALLFHDIEKPSCLRLDEEGRGHFPGHEKKSAAAAEDIMRRLHFDNNTVKNVSALVRYHYLTPIDDRRFVKRLMSVLGTALFFKLTEVMKGDNSAKQPFCLDRVGVLDTMKCMAYEIEESGECFSLDSLAVNGSDLIAQGLVGREIGSELKRLLSLVIDEEIPNEREALLENVRQNRSRS